MVSNVVIKAGQTKFIGYRQKDLFCMHADRQSFFRFRTSRVLESYTRGPVL